MMMERIRIHSAGGHEGGEKALVGSRAVHKFFVPDGKLFLLL